MSSVDWLNVLDLKRALINCHKDFLGDWYRDPWGWVELDWILANGRLEFPLQRLNGDGVSRTARLDVAKENFGIRPAIIMDPVDRLVYQALVDHFSVQLIGTMHTSVFGWRLPRRNARRGHYSRQSDEWEMFRHNLRTLGMFSKAALKTDIVSCFASIPVDRLCEDILDRRSNAVSKRLVDMIQGFGRIHGRSGLAQRSAASAVLANFYLAPVDEVLDAYRSVRGWLTLVFRRGRVTRWMDDIWVFGSESRLRKAQVDLQERLLDLRLNMNLGKTRLLRDEEVFDEVQRIEHSAVDADIKSSMRTLQPLNELVDALLMDPASADRTSVRFITKRMRDHNIFDRVPDFVDDADRLPHVFGLRGTTLSRLERLA